MHKPMMPLALLLSGALLPFCGKADGMQSTPTCLNLQPEKSSFWNTARSNELSVPVDFPAGATAAELKVEGCGYSRTYENTDGSDITVVLPPLTGPLAENVYDLTLAFDDPAQTVRHAKIGLVKSYSAGSQGHTRCLLATDTRKWSRVNDHAVLPVPAGTTSLTVNGESVEMSGLNGLPGWYALGGLVYGQEATVGLETGEAAYQAFLIGGPSGLSITIR